MSGQDEKVVALEKTPAHKTFLRACWCRTDCTKLMNNPIISDELKIELEKQIAACDLIIEEINKR